MSFHQEYPVVETVCGFGADRRFLVRTPQDTVIVVCGGDGRFWCELHGSLADELCWHMGAVEEAARFGDPLTWGPLVEPADA